MAFVVEDGTGLAGAESFVSVTDADTYLANRGYTTWAAKTTGEREIALRKATDFMEQQYRSRWDGWRVSATQFLSWPRYEVRLKDLMYGYNRWVYLLGYNVVPQLVKNACAELAYRTLTTALVIDVGRLKSRVQVGPISVTYADNATPQKVYTAVEDMLSPFFVGSKYSVPIIRV